MNQRTLQKKYSFEGKGLHTGKYAHMVVGPAPENTGIRFHRVDLGADAFVDAVAANVSSTARSTTISKGKVSVGTIEHILSALTGLGVDNALIEIDSTEVPILDGSARLYVEAMSPDGVVEQSEPRRWIELTEEVVVSDRKTGAYIKLSPAEDLSYDVTINFDSRVLGVQSVHWDSSVDYTTQVAPCRTFCFFHEIKNLLRFGLVKGGDIENAIVIVEKPVSDRTLARMAKLLKQPEVTVSPSGYLSNLELRFPDECGRHRLLDIMGDLRLVGGFLKARITAYKPGHGINTKTARTIVEKSI